MPLQFEVTSLDDVPEASRPYYSKTEAGTFRLQIDGLETAEQLRAGMRAEKAGLRAALAAVARLEKQAAESARRQAAQEQAQEAAQRRAEVEAQFNAEAEQRHVQRLAEFNASQQALIDGMRRDRDRVIVENAALDLARKLAARPEYVEVLLPHIAERLEGHEENGVFVVAVKNAGSLDELAAELFANAAFERIIIGASPQEKALHARRVAETLGTTILDS